MNTRTAHVLPVFAVHYKIESKWMQPTEGTAYIPAESLEQAQGLFSVLHYDAARAQIVSANEVTYRQANEANRGTSERSVGGKLINCMEYWTVRDALPEETRETFEKMIYDADLKLGRAAEIQYQNRRNPPRPPRPRAEHDLGRRF